MLHRRLAVWIVLISGTVIVPTTSLSGSARSRPEAPSIVVTNTAELVAALAPHPSDLTIYVQRGTYLLNHPIVVPENTTVIGDGLMEYEADGLPTGFVPDSRTVIAAVAGVTGDFVSLRDGASLRGLVIQDVVRPALTGGSVVVVSSQDPGDTVSTQVVECEIFNPNPVTGPGLAGPVGRGLLAITRNSTGAGGASPPEPLLVSVHLRQSIIRSPGGGDGIFAINFASGSHIELHLRGNVVGKLGANGGVARPDSSTVGATTLVQSIGNLYRLDNAIPNSLGWQFQGGSDPSGLPPGSVADATLNNKLTMHSVDDRIEGFPRAISATGGQRLSALSGAVASNEMELILQGTRLLSTTADFQLSGSRNLAGTTEGNELRVTMHHVIGSGPRTNTYADMTGNLGFGNRLIITGNVKAFSRTNEAILPAPGAQFFTAGR